MLVRLEVVQGRSAPRAIELDAATLDDARHQAQGRGYTVLSVRASPRDAFRLRLTAGSRKAGVDVPVFVEQLRDLLAAGLSVIESLSALREAAAPAARRVVDTLITRLRDGQRLSDALAADAVFPSLLVALVRSSELTSDLPKALSRYLENEQRAAELRHRVAAVAIYPVTLVVVGGAVLLFLLFYVIPRFARVFEGMEADVLPWSARAMVWWSQWFGSHSAVAVAATVVLVASGAVAVVSPSMRGRGLQALLAWSPVRRRLRTYVLARWYRSTGMLVEGGIPLVFSLRIANELLPSVEQRDGAVVEAAVRAGLSPATAYVQAGMATAVAEQLIRAGERTGDLGAVLGRIAQFHEAEALRSLERSMRALEPVVMALIGIGVGIVVVLMYLPIFELASTIQ